MVGCLIVSTDADESTTAEKIGSEATATAEHLVFIASEVVEPEPTATPIPVEAVAPDVVRKGPQDVESVETLLLEHGYYRDDVPLPYELQGFLRDACEESGVPYPLALAVIQAETQFRNVVGDDGASQGYMQVQQRWHHDRMERLGVTDLMDPAGNFRVGCDYLAELLETYDSVDLAVTVYNWGHNPGYITTYGLKVMGYYEDWKELLGDA